MVGNAMSEKASLLNQLKIDRAGAPESGSSLHWWLAGAAAVVVAGLGGWWAVASNAGVPVHAAAVQKIEASSSSPGVSLLDASGYVVAQLQAAVSGKNIYKVTSILVAEGQHVKKDEVIARLDDSNAHAALNQARAQVKAAGATVVAATRALANITPIYQRSQTLVKNGWISQDALDTARSTYDANETGLDVARKQFDVAQAALEVAERLEEDTIVRAPFDGVVTLKSAQPGQIVSPQFQGGGGIATIVDMDSLEVEVDVSEAFISKVHGNQPATIKLNAYPDWQIPGEVITVIPTADRAKAFQPACIH